MHSRYGCALTLRVRGGLNNQRECLINAILMARVLGLAGVLTPGIDLIGRGNEKFQPAAPQYVAPFNTSTCTGRPLAGCEFGALFDAHAWHTGPQTIVFEPESAAGARVIVLPPVEQVVPNCAGGGRFRETCAPAPGNATLFRSLAAAWGAWLARKAPSCLGRARDTVAADAGAGVRAGNSRGLKPPSVVIDAGRSLCWNAYQSRDLSACAALDASCPHAFRSVQSSAPIRQLVRIVLDGILSYAHRHQDPLSSGQGWLAIHLRAFNCVEDRGLPAAHSAGRPQSPSGPSAVASSGVLSLSGVLPGLLRRSSQASGGVVYVVSSVPVEEVRYDMC